MESYLVDWFSVIVRWLHLITGIAWIGASFHFVWLDNSLEPPSEVEQKAGIKGGLWSIHGGGIYHFSKYQLAPSSWPANLHWSKWEAYSTWMTGTLLMIGVYYLQAQSYLVGPDNWVRDPGTAVIVSLAYLAGGFLLYEAAIRTPLRNSEQIFAAYMVMVLVGLSWLSVQLFSDRAAFLHVGAVMGTIMAGNVFFGIIPAQKRFVARVEAGEVPDAAEAAFAKQRSTFNNYFTLPVLFCMISNHYPFLYGHAWNWLILVMILAITAYARHFFNLRHRGELRYGVLVRAALAFLLLAGWLGYDRWHTDQSTSTHRVSQDQIAASLAIHCTGCHARQPTQAGFTAPPGGIVLEDLAQLKQSGQIALTALTTGYMPLANMTGMTEEERAAMKAWISAGSDDAGD